MISYRQALRLDLTPLAEIRLAFSGAGGKTTALFRLARELPAPVLVTTTTHLGGWQLSLADVHLEAVSPLDIQKHSGQVRGVTLFTGPPREDHRVTGLEGETLQAVVELADRLGCSLLIEADGSRQLPLKAPAEHEPAIPAWARQVVVTAGLPALGRRLDEKAVHRFQRYAELAGAPVGAGVTPPRIARVLLHPAGGQKGIPPGARRLALLSQAVGPEAQAVGEQLAEALLTGFDAALVASSGPHAGIEAAFEPVGGVILAAGGARRFGGAKFLLAWRGQPLLRHAVAAALNGGLAEVVVVTGAYAEPARQALAGLPVRVVHNPDWEAGQSTSVKAGLSALSGRVGAALFLLADQPFVTSDLVRALRLAHAHSLAAVIAPRVGEQRTNPVLFDRSVFPDLLQIHGQAGGRILFDRYPPQELPWEDERLLLDVDTPEDYKTLLGFQ